MSDEIKREVETNEDGSVSVSTSFSLTADNIRPVNDEVVAALDDALGELSGNEPMHMFDPARMVSYESGGPAVWSIGVVEVGELLPYTLLLTYGFSHAVSPEDFREGIGHEFSIAVPHGQPVQPWAAALLRHMASYVLGTGRAIEVGHMVPAYGPITCWPFQPEHHGEMPPTELEAVIAVEDPVLPKIETPAGTIAVRRLMGVRWEEQQAIETWRATSFAEEFAKLDPNLLTDLERPSALDDPDFAEAAENRAALEGSDIPAFMAAFVWEIEESDLLLSFRNAGEVERILAGVRGRVGFGQTLLVVSETGHEWAFAPTDEPTLEFDGPTLVMEGSFEDMEDLLDHILEVSADVEGEFTFAYPLS